MNTPIVIDKLITRIAKLESEVDKLVITLNGILEEKENENQRIQNSYT